jgi:flagellar biosynthesis/type III secretory pathway protein FliH
MMSKECRTHDWSSLEDYSCPYCRIATLERELAEARGEVTRLEGWTRKVEAERNDAQREAERLRADRDALVKRLDDQRERGRAEGRREGLEEAAKAVYKLSKMPSAYEDAIRALQKKVGKALLND